jgi:hypothetical protein
MVSETLRNEAWKRFFHSEFGEMYYQIIAARSHRAERHLMIVHASLSAAAVVLALQKSVGDWIVPVVSAAAAILSAVMLARKFGSTSQKASELQDGWAKLRQSSEKLWLEVQDDRATPEALATAFTSFDDEERRLNAPGSTTPSTTATARTALVASRRKDRVYPPPPGPTPPPPPPRKRSAVLDVMNTAPIPLAPHVEPDLNSIRIVRFKGGQWEETGLKRPQTKIHSSLNAAIRSARGSIAKSGGGLLIVSDGKQVVAKSIRPRSKQER